MRGINFVGTISFAIIAIHSVLKVAGAESSGIKKMNNVRNVEEFASWKQLQSDGFELYLVNLPDYVVEKKIYAVEKGRDETIGHFALSPDYRKAAFTTGNFGSRNHSDNLYIFDLKAGILRKIGYSLSVPINLRGFLKNNRLLLEGNLSIEGGLIIFHEKPADHSNLFSYDLATDSLERFNDLGATTVGMANSVCSSDGNVFAYQIGSGFAIYNIAEKCANTINKIGDLVAISSKGERILFRRDRNYYLIDQDGNNEISVLSVAKVRNAGFLYRLGSELNFFSWSPNGKYIILFNEPPGTKKQRPVILDLETKQIIQNK